MSEANPFQLKSDHVKSTLKGWIDKGDYPKGARIPPMRKLAMEFEVSLGTVESCLKSMEEEGIVEKRVGSGVFVTSGPEDNNALDQGKAPVVKSRVEELVDQIAANISSGHYKAGQPLPMKKALRFQYHTSWESLKSALAELEKKGIVHRKGGAFIAGTPDGMRNPQTNSVFLIPARSASGGLVWGNPPRDEFHFAFGKELSNHGVSFLGRFNVATETGKPLRKLVKRKALGFVCSASNMRWVEMVCENDSSWLQREFDRLNKAGLPVVFFSCAPILNAMPTFTFRRLKNVFPFGMDNLAAGHTVARYLGIMGHRNLAFFSYSDELWNRPRYQGATKGLADVTNGRGRVEEYNAEVDKFFYSSRQPSRKAFDGRIRKLIADSFSKSDLSSTATLHEVRTAIRKTMILDHHHRTLWPLFEKALQNRSITGWVGADQTVSMLANGFLAEKGLISPRKISVISIDDHIQLSDQGITACSMGLDRMGYLAAHCLLGDIPIKKDKRGVVECPPRIIERGTVGRV